MIHESRTDAATIKARALAAAAMPMHYGAWVGRLAGRMAEESVRAADAVLQEPAVVEQIAAESWDALIEGAAPWDEQDEDTKELHAATVRTVIAAFSQGSKK
jgi:hypothetical protein